MKNVVECPREFIAYFNALETTCDHVNGLLVLKSYLIIKDLPSYVVLVGDDVKKLPPGRGS